ncbi:hypothetical protein N7462_006050 [Penicillium macrosclerotiorum]|uniref:uncharacterized protein n=1 Tax=Penicillium macrosclerotiorum TaxID=303699 RepID=UPI00254949E4|nr:uncharacterized protein N7462_006050 [Penicillium macrosclerotiorum]KAJ5682885.1 hypothetical protein N7462_006050 [Penicillium macrosclerotiorum]
MSQIEYIWKIARPKNDTIAKAIMYTAYQTAIQTDPNPVQVLIRSYVHATTKTPGGKFKKDLPHITVPVKNQAMMVRKTHIASHGYTTKIQSVNVTRVTPSAAKKDFIGSAWPDTMSQRPKESHTGTPMDLGPNESFYTWPSEQTGQ